MKTRAKLLWVWIPLCLAVTVFTAYYLYQQRVEKSKVSARETFAKALELEMQKRDTMKIYLSYHGKMHIRSQMKVKCPKTVTITSKEYGKKEYRMDPHRHEHNIENDPQRRGLQGMALEKYPLNVNLIHCIWDSLLADRSISVHTLVRLSFIDLGNKEHISYSGDTLQFMPTDSLSSLYIGYRCEREVTSFVVCAGFEVYTISDWLLLIGIVVLSIGICYAPYFYKHYFIEKHIKSVEKERPVVFVKEKNISPVRFGDGVIFDVAHALLGKEGQLRSIPPQTAMLFNAFLNAGNYKLSMEEIHEVLWPGQVESRDRIYNAVNRLRTALAKFTHWSVRHGGDFYWLADDTLIQEDVLCEDSEQH